MEPPALSASDGAPSPIQPMFLLADSQLLFHRDERSLSLPRVREALGERDDVAAAATSARRTAGPLAEYYDLFVAAMEGIGVLTTRMIPRAPSDDDRDFLDRADIVLLAGGDAARGFRACRESGLGDRIVARSAAGAVLIGISRAPCSSASPCTRTRGPRPRRLPPRAGPRRRARRARVERAHLGGRGTAGRGARPRHPVRRRRHRALGPHGRAGAQGRVVEISVEEGVVRRAALIPGSAAREWLRWTRWVPDVLLLHVDPASSNSTYFL